MSLLIINTMSPDNAVIQDTINRISVKYNDTQVIHTFERNISHCIGCYTCMLHTPGVCCIKDDFTDILDSIRNHTKILFISDTVLDFIDYNMKKIIDRSFPLLSLYTHYVNGELRHITNHHNNYEISLIYNGDFDETYLNEWLSRIASQLGGRSIGAFPLTSIPEVLK